MKHRDRDNDDIELKRLKFVDLNYLNNFDKQKQD